MKYPNTYIAWDLETTGLDPQKDHIIEIGAVLVEGGVETNRISMLLNHRIEIPEFITKLTGITRAEIDKDGIDPEDAWKLFFNFMNKADWRDGIIPNLTHNGVNFDFKFLGKLPGKYYNNIEKMKKGSVDSAMMYKAKELGMPQAYNENLYDFNIRVGKVIAKGVFFNINHCCKELGIDNGRGHRALDDARASHEIYQKLIK